MDVLCRLNSSLGDDLEMSDNDAALDAATRLIHMEMATLINHDSRSNPIILEFDPIIAGVSGGVKKDKKGKKRKHQSTMEDIPEVSLDYFPEKALDSAKQLLAEEFKLLVQEKRELLSSAKGIYHEDDADVLNALVKETVAASRDGANQGVDEIDTLLAEYTALQSATQSLVVSNAKLEQKLQIHTGGYCLRSNAIIDSTLHSFAELQHSRIEQRVYSRLRAHETKGVVSRLEQLTEEVEMLEGEEMNKQKKYGELIHEKNRLLLKINSVKKKMEN
jgi:hypothetical protein